VKEHNKEKAEAAFADLGFAVVTGSRHLGGFIGEKSV
jgi:N-formylglutamate amidohydrolase